ncbi:MAG: pantetheine-phosphate adenylyltransferase [Collinsella sp.]
MLVPGTFDPITYGHIDVVRRALRICPRGDGCRGRSLGKNGVGTTFTLDERVELARRALHGMSGVDVSAVYGAVGRFCAQVQAGAVVRACAPMTDFEYELQQADLNYRLDAGLESIFVMSSPEYGYLSSSVVRQIASFGGEVDTFVPPCVAAALKERFCGLPAAI